MPIFSFVTYSSDRGSPLPSYLKLVLQPYVKSGSRKKKLRAFDCLLMIHDLSRTSTAPSYLRRAVGEERCGLHSLVLTGRDLPKKLAWIRYLKRKNFY